VLLSFLAVVFTRATLCVERVIALAVCLAGWLSVTAGIVSKWRELAS